MSFPKFDTLRLEREGAVAVLSLNRPDVGNAINLAMARDLLLAAIACDQDQAIGAVLLRADGPMFCVGGDVMAFANAGDSVGTLILEEIAFLHAAVSRLLRMDKPLVVAVHAPAAGAGMSLAMMGDIVIAGQAANFTMAYTRIGLSPDGGASWLLPRLVGLRRAQALIFENQKVSAREAVEIGLVTQVVDDASLMQVALDGATRLAHGPTGAFAATRDLLLGSYGESVEVHLEHEARRIANNIMSAHGQEGVAAFVEKRQPVFDSETTHR
ncbi:enoyl-CoA hydratase-related protein [Sphingomonas sp. MG17]|uniref:Enoyl-CoA hydratase-related protein n=1 Tax=Sphingomonas tagetis TaxID=2949092 RepID=A0A9X2HPB7_9SPHN|nr:enoyl-CoA hydratase-related protein [Sphingomonas tagetis]MCP3732096.1 enoyl-CoA hydratase-related protein [Sphingomonas tagetis]